MDVHPCNIAAFVPDGAVRHGVIGIQFLLGQHAALHTAAGKVNGHHSPVGTHALAALIQSGGKVHRNDCRFSIIQVNDLILFHCPQTGNVVDFRHTFQVDPGRRVDRLSVRTLLCCIPHRNFRGAFPHRHNLS